MRTLTSTEKKYLADLALLVISQVFFYYGVKYIMNQVNPLNQRRKEHHEKTKRNLSRLGIANLKLNSYEEILATELVFPEDIEVNFAGIGGLDGIIQELHESVILPLKHPEFFAGNSKLYGAPKGVLLYGPPGCGKTMLAKALAKESGATFVNLHISTMTDKWFGESNKLVAALFSLAKKLQPTIIFIDEIDSFLRERRSNDHEAMSMVKAEFMSLWDGLTTAQEQKIVILGATNRPNDIDPAILRRMPKKFAVRPPDLEQRRNILSIMLNGIALDDGLDIHKVAEATEDFSGSDLNELCRNAAMRPLRELMRNSDDVSKLTNVETRPLTLQDFMCSAPLQPEPEPQD